MTQVEGIPYRRHGPSAALQAFLDPLDPGDYFDCGRARLHGLDDALLDEARQRGRVVGDDSFQLVATDMGLIFCRPSISFAIAARWEEVSLIRPRGGDPVVLPITWPRHGELKFTVSKRLAGNIFRRWLQLRMLAARRARQGNSGRFSRQELRRGAEEPVLTGGHQIDLRPRDDEVGTADADPGDADGPRAAAPTGPAAVGPTLDDHQLQRVAVPGPQTTPSSWIGSALSLALSVVVLSSFVLIVAVSVGVYRGTVVDGRIPAPAGPMEAADDIGRTTIDHRRFSPTANRSARLAEEEAGTGSPVLTPIGTGSSQAGSSGPSAGGAAVARDSSSQAQLVGGTDETSGAISDGAISDGAVGDEAIACNSNYGGCVPVVSGEADGIDCAGQGPGPNFVASEVPVMGEDVYGLDTDGDGRACDPDQPPTGDSDAVLP